MGIRVNPAVQAAIERAEREGRVHDPAAEAARAAAEREALAPTPEEERQAEKAFQADVVKFAKKHGWKVYHTYDSRRSEAGFFDLELVRERLVKMELKVEPNKPSAAQLSWFEAYQAAKVEAYILWPKDWPKIVEVLT